jgi:phosphoglycerate dehydrogenase-like enzyme
VTPILVDMPVKPEALRRLQALPGVTVQTVEPSEESRGLPPELLRDQRILFCTVPPRNLADMMALEVIQICSAGYDQLIGLGLPGRNVRACNARGVYDTTIAEWNVLMMIALGRDLRGMIHNQERGAWDRAAPFQQEIRGRVVGLWGYGGLGRETARLAKALGLTVHVFTRRGVRPRRNTYVLPGVGDPEGRLPDRTFTTGQELEFLAGLDFLVLAMPKTPQSKGRIGEEELRALRPTALVLNPARGPLIQEEALLRALREGWIAGAALDTHYHYPMPPDHPLWRFPNVIMTPHIAGGERAPYFLDRIWDVFVQNVERYLAGQPLLNELTPAELNGE